MNAKLSTLSLAIGSVFAVSLIAAPAAKAAGNPFGMQQLNSGYLVADAKAADGKCGDKKGAKDHDGKCGEGKCGDKMGAKDLDGKCGDKKANDGDKK